MEFEIRDARRNDINQLLELYTHLHNNPIPEINDRVKATWNKIIDDKNHHVIIGFLNNRAISSCVLLIVPNMTWGQRPYALIENVITHSNYRNKGYASAVLNYAKRIAIDNNCYKIMLMTGSKEKSTLDFYRKAGYNSEDKTAFIQWL
jgi:GNAT superfamily N-acetyltransferase